MEYRENYKAWLNNPYFDEATRAELQSLKILISYEEYLTLVGRNNGEKKK